MRKFIGKMWLKFSKRRVRSLKKSSKQDFEVTTEKSYQNEVQTFLLRHFGSPKNKILFQFKGVIKNEELSFDVVIDESWTSDIRKGLSERKKIKVNGSTLMFSSIGYDEEEILTCYFKDYTNN